MTVNVLYAGGGDSLPTSAIVRFCEWCKSYRPDEDISILIIPWASSRPTETVFLEYSSENWFGGHAKQINMAPSYQELLEDSVKIALFKELLCRCSGGNLL